MGIELPTGGCADAAPNEANDVELANYSTNAAQRSLQWKPSPKGFCGKTMGATKTEAIMTTPGYTAVIRQDGPWWIGWIEEVPGVNSQSATREELIDNLR